MNKIQKEDLLYLAGLIDGDGSIIAQFVKKNDYVMKYQIRFTIQITQLKKRRHFLVQFQEIIGSGTVRDREEMSDYVLTDTNLVGVFLEQLTPYLRIKKKQADLVIKIIQQLPSARKSKDTFIQLCKLVDQVSALNDSKNRKITSDVVANELLKNDDCLKLDVPVETSDN